jgi:hypothetical protein
MDENSGQRGISAVIVAARHRLVLGGALLALECVGLVGCAPEVTTTDPNVAAASGSEARPRRRRRRRRPEAVVVADTTSSAATEPGGQGVGGSLQASAPSVAGEIGTPVASASGASSARVRVEWMPDGEGGELLCGAAAPARAVRCPQCPREPENAGIVRAFVAVEREVIRCSPPSRADGKLPVRVQFAGDGRATAMRFPGVRLDEGAALCLGRALCTARVPNFQNPVATVPYEIHVLVPES